MAVLDLDPLLETLPWLGGVPYLEPPWFALDNSSLTWRRRRGERRELGDNTANHDLHEVDIACLSVQHYEPSTFLVVKAAHLCIYKPITITQKCDQAKIIKMASFHSQSQLKKQL